VANVLAAAIERRNNEERLNSLAVAEQAHAAQLRAVIESIGDAVVVCDAIGSVLLSNPAADAMLGPNLSDGLAGIMRAFEWPDDLDPYELPPTEAIEVRLAAWPGPTDQTERWVELSAFPVRGTDERAIGRGGGTILVLRDVTASRAARNVREAFLGVLSHELRTPVTTIYGGAEVVSRKGDDMNPDARREILDDIREDADRLYRLVENLLVLSRVERQGLQIETEPILLQRLIPRVVDAESARWPNASWEQRLPAGLPPVATEETYIEQVLRNLLSNAAKYGGDGLVTITAEDRGATVAVAVSDSGAGIDEDEVELLFELFYRSPSVVRRASGAGIGLFVSRNLIRAMGGDMRARNRPEGGAVFEFDVPVFDTGGD
jgi:signal transduction histidine kinase